MVLSLVLSFLVFQSFTIVWLILSISLGGAYAWWLYYAKLGQSFSSKIQIILALFRGVVVGMIVLLLAAPLMKSHQSIQEKPIILFALDESSSMKLSLPKNTATSQIPTIINTLSNDLSSQFECKTIAFGEHISDTLSFLYKDKKTDFSALFKEINLRYSHRNLGAIVLLSDGIYNVGENPMYSVSKIKTPIYTIGFGNTEIKKDVLIGKVKFNKTVYLGNDFQIEIPIIAKQLSGKKVILSVMLDNQTITVKDVQISKNDYFVSIPIVLKADKVGIKHIQISLSEVPQEATLQNNQQTIFVEVLNAKDKILILAKSPHPDVAAIRQSLEANQNYEIDICFETQLATISNINKYSVAVLHQNPSPKSILLIEKLKTAKIPLLFIVGNQSDLKLFNKAQNYISISSFNGSFQDALPKLSASFYGFNLTDPTRQKLNRLGPLSVPYGNFSINNVGKVLFTQKIGSVETEMPLMFFGEDGFYKTGIIVGEGLWKWKFEDWADNNSHESFNELMTRTIKFLSTKDDKRKFKASPIQHSFSESEEIVFNAELYNDSYELMNNPEVALEIKDKQGKLYPFTFLKNEKAYELHIGALPNGVYSYKARALITNNTSPLEDVGKFIVEQQNLELTQITPNQKTLYSLSKETNGVYFDLKNWEKITESIQNNPEIKTIRYYKNTYSELASNEWIFVLLLILMTVEWLVRKREGRI